MKANNPTPAQLNLWKNEEEIFEMIYEKIEDPLAFEPYPGDEKYVWVCDMMEAYCKLESLKGKNQQIADMIAQQYNTLFPPMS